MKKVIVFGASNSKQSINQQLAIWAANQLSGIAIQEIHLSDYEAPIYSIDRETTDGFPAVIMDLKNEIKQADALIISLAEHNGNFTAAFKNIYDWLSRTDRSVWNDMPMLLLATSPGKGGGSGVLALALKGFPYAGGNIVGSYSLPSFQQSFDTNGITDPKALKEFNKQLDLLKKHLS